RGRASGSGVERVDRRSARQKLGLDPNLTTMLIMGGSQGASGINQAVIKSLPLLRESALQVIHLSGSRDERLIADSYRRERVFAYLAAFHHHLGEGYIAADFFAAPPRAGRPAEHASFPLARILRPFPHSSA